MGPWPPPFMVLSWRTQHWHMAPITWNLRKKLIHRSTKPDGIMEAQHELELFLGLLFCFFKNLSSLWPWTLLVVQGDDVNPRKQPCGKSEAHGHGARFSDDRKWSSSPGVSGLILADNVTYWISSSFCGNSSVNDLIWISGAEQARKISDF